MTSPTHKIPCLNLYAAKLFDSALDEFGAFFAFGKDQFEKRQTPGVEYVGLGSGLTVPKLKKEKFNDRLDKNYEIALAKLKKDHSDVAIIKYELANYECYYSGDPFDAVRVLVQRGYSEQQIKKIYETENERRNALDD